MIKKIQDKLAELNNRQQKVTKIFMERGVWQRYSLEVQNLTGLHLCEERPLKIGDAGVQVEHIEDSYHSSGNRVVFTIEHEVHL